MTINSENKKIKFIVNATYIFYIAFLIYIALKYSFKIFLPFLISLIIATVAEPFVSVFTTRFRLKRQISALLCIIIIFMIIFAIVALLSAFLINFVMSAADLFPGFLEDINKTLDSYSKNGNNFWSNIITSFVNYLNNTDLTKIVTGSIGSSIIKPVSEMVKSLPSFMLSFLITIISSVLISASYPTIKKVIIAQFKPDKKEVLIKLKDTFKNLIVKYLKSYTVIMLLTFTELALLFWIFKIKPPVILAFVISLIDILPVLGTGIILIPWSAYLFFTGNVTKGAVILSIYLLTTVIRQIAEPRIIGKSIGLHPLLTLISIYIGFRLFGIIGIITAPIGVMLLVELNNNDVIRLWNKINIDNGDKQ